MEHAFSEHLLNEGHHARGSVVLALIGGFAAAVIGASIWTAFALISGWDAGFLALGIGAMVGFSIQVSGRGSHFIYGVFGIIFTLLSCLAGEILVSLVRSMSSVLDLYAVMMNTDLAAMASSIISHVSPMMSLVYAMGAFEAYMLSLRK